LAARIQEAQDWACKYQELVRRVQENAADDELSLQAANLLHEGDG
jgi:hypothetical protein